MFCIYFPRRLSRCSAGTKFVSTLVRNTAEIRCCGTLYKSWSDSNLKPHLPKPKRPYLRMDLEYLRSPHRNKNMTVLALHGSPGNAEHFRVLGDSMHELCGADFIVPSFPDISYTLRTGDYYHSAEEKVEMVEALLQKLGISEVDLIIAHSAGTQPALLMSSNQKKIRVRSIALICSTTHKLIPAYQPLWFNSKLVSLLHIPILKNLLIPSFEVVTWSLGLKKMTAVEAATSMTSAYATRYWSAGGVPKWIKDLRNRDLPRMTMYSSKDFVVPRRLSKEFVKELGNGDEENHFIYEGRTDADLRLTHEPLNMNLAPVINFAEGGHNAMTQFPLTVADHLLRFVRAQGLLEAPASYDEKNPEPALFREAMAS